MPVFGSQQSGIVRPALLAYVESITGAWRNSTSTTFEDVDATNLVVTFVAPASGSVVVELSALASCVQTTPDIYWTMRDGTVDVHAGVGVKSGAATPADQWERCQAVFRVTGLTPGKSYTWKWAHRTSTAATTVRTYAGGAFYPSTIKVFDAGTSQSGVLSGGVWAGPQAIKQASSSDVPLRLQDTAGADLLKAGPSDITGKLWRQSMYNLKAGFNVTGGGNKAVRHVSAGVVNVTWSARFIVIGNGRGSDLAPAGYFDIGMPANGTVIPGVGAAGSVTVSGGFIQLSAWHSLYYILPLGGASGTVAANFRVVGYSDNDHVIPEHWVLVAQNNSDNLAGTGEVRWCDGDTMTPWITPALQNGWTQYGAPWGDFLGYRRQNGMVVMRGLIHSGTVGATAFVMAAGFRPISSTIFGCVCSTSGGAISIADVRAMSDGTLQIALGQNGWVSLANITYPAEN